MGILTNATSLFGANALSSLAQYAILVLIARALGPASLGEYLFAWTYAWLFASLCNFGLDRIVIRDVVRQESATSSVFTAALTLRVVLGGAALVLAEGIARAFHFGAARRELVVLLVASLVLTQLTELLRSLFFAAGAMPREAALRSAGRVAALVAVAWILAAGGGLRAVGLTLVLVAVPELVVYLWSASTHLGVRFVRLDRGLCRRLVLDALPIAITTLLVLVYFRANVMMLTAWHGVEAAGWFGAAFTFIQALQLVSGTLASVLLPSLVAEQRMGRGDLAAKVRALTYYVLLCMVPTAVVLASTSSNVINLVYGTQYEVSGAALRILAWAGVFMFLGSLYGTILVVLDKQGGLLWTSVMAAVLSLVANAWLIPPFGVVGAGWATVTTEALVAGMSFWFVSRHLSGAWPGLVALKPVGVGGAMVLAAWLAADQRLSLRLGALALAGVLAVVVLRALSREHFGVALAGLRSARADTR